MNARASCGVTVSIAVVMTGEKFDADNAKAWIAQGKVQWHYHCIEPNAVTSLNTFIERPPFQARLLLWLSSMLPSFAKLVPSNKPALYASVSDIALRIPT